MRAFHLSKPFWVRSRTLITVSSSLFMAKNFILFLIKTDPHVRKRHTCWQYYQQQQGSNRQGTFPSFTECHCSSRAVARRPLSAFSCCCVTIWVSESKRKGKLSVFAARSSQCTEKIVHGISQDSARNSAGKAWGAINISWTLKKKSSNFKTTTVHSLELLKMH